MRYLGLVITSLLFVVVGTYVEKFDRARKNNEESLPHLIKVIGYFCLAVFLAWLTLRLFYVTFV